MAGVISSRRSPMNFKTLLSVVDVRQNDDDLKTAIELCAEINAQLSVVVLAIATLPPLGDYPIGTADAWLKDRHNDLEALSKRVDRVEMMVKNADISATVIDEYPEAAKVARVIGRHARYADATIIGASLLRNDLLKTTVVDGALFESGRPILIVPSRHKPTLRPRRVLLAWDSGVECTRAAREALDVMASAEEVHVTLVDPDTSSITNGPEPGADIAAYLAHHEIKVDVDRLPSGGKSIADVLKQHATDISAELIVMGGYGHSRTREWIFGGVTRSMIDDPNLPVLMAH
jgi:nucleotide-binding universal stress UspA family protein